MIRQPDGKLILAGSLAGPTGQPTGGMLLARVLDDGTLDSSFGTGGIVNTLVGDQTAAHSVALQSDGGSSSRATRSSAASRSS